MEGINYKVRVLIVEDEPLIAENIAMYLNNNDYEVAGIAYDYEEGLLKLNVTKPDIVFIGYQSRWKAGWNRFGRLHSSKIGYPFCILELLLG
jgi:DNA-binding response OmpR family regulator